MDQNVKDRILNRPRAREIAERPHPADSLQELRRKYGGPGVSDEELLLRFFTSKEDVERMRAAGPARAYAAGGNPLVTLIAAISKDEKQNSVYIENRKFTLRLEKRRTA